MTYTINVHGLYEKFIICILIVINKQTNKQINNSLSITENCNMGKSK
jgi:hypothetical protein